MLTARLCKKWRQHSHWLSSSWVAFIQETNQLLTLKKLATKGGLAEHQIFLWKFFDLRCLQISLCINKFKAWSMSINDQQITLRRRLSWAASSTHVHDEPHGHSFSEPPPLPPRPTKSQPEEEDDLEHMKSFLEIAHQEINMNLLTFHQPSIVFRLNASTTHDQGGYSANSCIWRCPFPHLGSLSSTSPFLNFSQLS